VEGVLVAEVEARPRAIAADIGVYFPGIFEGIMYISIIWASAGSETVLPVHASLRVHKYRHLFISSKRIL
jgi:hypothetical protein